MEYNSWYFDHRGTYEEWVIVLDAFFISYNTLYLNNLNFFFLFSGRRACMGETLAKMELFLYFSSLIQQFKFELPPGAEVPSTEPVKGFTLSPKPFQVIITKYC